MLLTIAFVLHAGLVLCVCVCVILVSSFCYLIFSLMISFFLLSFFVLTFLLVLVVFLLVAFSYFLDVCAAWLSPSCSALFLAPILLAFLEGTKSILQEYPAGWYRDLIKRISKSTDHKKLYVYVWQMFLVNKHIQHARMHSILWDSAHRWSFDRLHWCQGLVQGRTDAPCLSDSMCSAALEARVWTRQAC